jgi:hypothetical protein
MNVKYEGITGRICPVCKKEFFPAPYHTYKIWFYKYGYVWTCSYSCHCKVKAESERRKNEGKKDWGKKKGGKI